VRPPLTRRLQRILPPRMPFFVCHKVQISSKICHKSRILLVFRRTKMRPFQQRIGLTVTAVNLFYEVLKKWMDNVNKDTEAKKLTVHCTTSNGSGVGQKQMETSSSSLIIIEMMEESRRRRRRRSKTQPQSQQQQQ